MKRFRKSKPKTRRPTYALWWIALIILAVGGIYCGRLWIYLESGDWHSKSQLGFAITVVVVSAGSCLIASFAPCVYKNRPHGRH